MMRIAHTLFVDIVGYSRASLDAQAVMLRSLTDVAQGTTTFVRAQASGRVIAIPTGDGMALVFDDDVSAPARCALEVARAVGKTIPLRMGIHSGLVQTQTDITGKENVVGEGINTAQRVMDFGDTGHILLSEQHAQWLRQAAEWQGKLFLLGSGTAKHGLHLTLYALSDGISGRRDAPKLLATTAEVQPEDAPRVVLLCRRGGPREEDILGYIEEQLTAQGFAVYRDRSRQFRPSWAEEMRERIREASAVLALISPESRQSEMLPWELEQARERFDATGRPSILPLFIGTQDEIHDDVERYLHELPRFLWISTDDNHRIVAEIVSAIRGPIQPSGEIRLEPVGGAVPLDSAFYITRRCDADLISAVDARESILLIAGARQVGKTSLIARAAHHAREQGARVAQTDFQQLNASFLTDEVRFYRSVAATLARQLHFNYDFANEWDDFLAPNENLNYFLEALADAAPSPLVWCMDEADKLFPAPFASDFFGLVRSWHNSRASRPAGPWQRLTVLIAYATEARLFIRDLNQSPFNVGRKIELEDFDRDQFRALNARYGDPLKPSECDEVFALLEGQPFLCRKALDAVATDRWTFGALLADAARNDGPFADHLQRLLIGVTELPEVTAFVRDTLAGKAFPAKDQVSFDRLHSAGVIRRDRDGAIRFRCPLYFRYLSGRLSEV